MSLRFFRSLTILLVLELAVFERQADAFTIQRASQSTTPLTDLTAAESISLAVRNDLQRAKTKDIPATNATATKTVPIQTTAKTEEIKKNETKHTTIKPTAYSTTAKLSIPKNNSTTSIPKLKTNSTRNVNATETRNVNVNITSPNTNVTNRPANNTPIALTNSTKNITEETTDTTELTTENTSDISGNEEVTNATEITTTLPQLNDSLAIENNTNVKNVTTTPATTNAGPTLLTTDRLGRRRTGESNETSYSTEAVETDEATSTDISSTKDIDGTSQSETSSEIPSTISVINSTSSDITTLPSSLNSITSTANSETTTAEEKISTVSDQEKSTVTDALKGEYSAVTAIPYWKKYTQIERKRVTPSEDTSASPEQDDHFIKSGTAQTSVTIENPFRISSDIPSIEELKNVLLHDSKTQTVYIPSTLPLTLELLTTSTSENSEITTETETTTLKQDNILSSKRAGYLDFSSKTKDVETTIQTTVRNTPYPITTSQTIPVPETTKLTTAKPRQVIKKITSMTSQSQLAEDAIKEELMKEEVLSDTVENLNRQGEDRFGNKILTVDETTRGLGLTFPDESNEDKLSVKPISAEKQRSGLYTVNPNYKPLKKIEVQPPKPFVRNPDDNSWRNESLSSLGIVFKANNSTKPFTEVLKNKTEIEWNTLLEKYGKEETTSELRDRLEKIAEKRKKKKKINRFGETVYTDYEETISGEAFNPVKQRTTTEVVDNVRNNPTIAPAVVVRKPTKIFEFEAITLEGIDTTTSKSQKEIDEYEADDEPDYTLANIDLKKFMKSGTEASSIEPTGTPPQTVYTYPPDRKPTIQYFPPRQKPKKQKVEKVVVNDYDTDFQRKINEYTYSVAAKQTKPFEEILPTHPPFYFPRVKDEEKRPNDVVQHEVPADIKKINYLKYNSPLEQTAYPEANQDGGFNRASYVIKHLRDFIEEVVNDDDHSIAVGTQPPLPGITRADPKKTSVKPPNDYYDYEAQFRKDVLDRFVENFNQNSDKYKVDFPILYNSTIVHNMMEEAGQQASSSAFMKRLYEDARAFQHAGRLPKRLESHVHCDRTVELSPAYELHYYVPDEEEKEEIEQKPITVSYRL